MDFVSARLHKLGTMGLAFLRSADWLTPVRVKAYLWILAALNVSTLAALAITARNGVDRNGFLLGTDFLSFWTVGSMLASHADVYDQAAHIAAQQAYFTQSDAFTAFFYPPSFLPFCWPLGWLPYFPALAVWLVSTGALFAWAVARWLTSFPVAASMWLLLAAFPATVIQITHGQTAFLLAGLLLLGTLWVRERPMLAGVMFGVATIKPQFGLLVPLVLVLTGEQRLILVAASTALVLAGVSALLFGAGTWSQWYALTQAAQSAMAGGSVGYAKMVSPFAGLMLLGNPPHVSYIGQGAVSAGVVLMLSMAGWRRTFTPELGALMLVGAVLVTPFVLDYDLLLLVPAMIVVAAYGTPGGFAPWEKLAVFLAFAAPAFARPIGLNLHLPILPLIAFFLFWVLWKRLRASAAPSNPIIERQIHA
jgi:hypothetical protein